MWKGIALLLALAMIPAGVFAADGDTATTVSITSATYAEATNTVTVTGTISDAEADVTILALRAAEALDADDLAGYSDTDLSNGVVYIDQEAFEGGNFTFEFIPRSGIKGGKMTIFVGGENVSAIDLETIDAAVKAPDVVPAEPWYEGDDLKLNIYKAGTEEPYGDATAIDGWANAINSFKVNGSDATYNHEPGASVITVSGVTASVTSIAITTENGDYSEETWSGSVAQVKKPAGTITATAASITAGNDATFTVAESTVAGWLAGVEAAVKVDGTAAVAELEGTTLTVELPALGDAEESKEYTVTVEVANYEVATAKVTAVAPTKLAADALTAPVVTYSESEFAETPADGTADADKGKLYGKAFVELPATIEGVDVAWTIDAESKSAGTVELERALSTDEEPKTTFTAVATVSMAGYKTIEKTFTLTVNQCGVQGIDVDITLTMPEAAGALATVTVDDVAATQNGLVFTAAALADGDHTVVVARPGYATLTITLTIANGEVTSNNTTIAMVGGDTNGDGKVHADDYMDIVNNWRASAEALGEAFPNNCDINGDGTVHADDYMAIVNNWRYGM